jgi:radical SAM protein (TIGR01212 family)
MEYLKTTKAAKKFIAYFQAFTNTYAPADTVKRVYDEVLSFEDVVGMTIGTRPDAVDREKLAVISSYKGRYEVWLEYGLQSIHDRTLEAIKRAHTYKDFTDAVSMTRQFGIPICAHIILGLPGESREEMIATAKALTHLKINGVKIHLLHVLKGTVLERLYLNGKVALLEENEYAELVCDFLENLSPDIIIQRLTGEGNTLNHVAPSWAHNKLGTINRIKAILRKRGSWQGYRLAKA